ncbi:MAG: Na/Pi cotransporter family protein [Clostridia bacterium]|nr:Na/Pi cotransporter family protein [Clostridia bacterium]MBR0206791.1 Na/Pi cotransporter family protein [Clostridia bacterium]
MGITNVLSLLCGVALFLYGMSVMGDGLKRVAGNKLEVILWRLSSTPLKGVLLGFGVTAAIQSSSATTIMVIGFVNSGMMKGIQSIPIILGANVGTSVTGWLLCLSLLGEGGGWVSLFSTATITAAVAIIGTLLRMLGKSSAKKHVGDILLGFAVLMFGMSVMSDAVLPLKESAKFREFLLLFDNPLLGILAGAAFTAVLQSASAAVGILQALSMTGAITAEAAIPIIMGVAIGASVPVLLGAIGAGPTGRRTSLVYLFINVLGTLICLVPYFIATALLPESVRHGAVGPVELALINSVFRILATVALLPFIKGLRRLAHRLVKDRPEDLIQQAMIDKLEERFVAHPALAIEQSKIVIAKMADTAQENLVRALKLLSAWSETEYGAVERLEEQVDTYEDKLGSYLVKVNRQELDPGQNKEISKFLHCISDIERISDHAMNVGEVAREIAEKKVVFSDDAKRELNVLIAAVEEIVGLAMGAFEAENVKEAYKVEPLEEMIDMLCDELKLHHVNRVQAGQCTLDQGFVFNDLITNLERVADHCSNIAVAMIELEAGVFDTHEYLNSLKQVQSDSFNRFFEQYQNKYDLNKGSFTGGVYDLSSAESASKSAAKATAPAAVSSSREP